MSVNNGPLASNLIHVIGLKKVREDGSSIITDTITIGREGSTTTIGSDSLVVSKINVGSSNTLSIASNVNVSMGSPTTLFTFTPSGITVTVARIAYGNGKFVVIGDTAKVYHSSNGTTWTQVTSPTFPGAMRTVLYANDKFMIFSETVTNVIYTSPDGAIWNTVTVNTQPSNYMYSVAYGNNSLVGITPNTGSIHVSTSTPLGSIWSSVTIPGGLLFFIAAFGKMTNTANGTNVFIVAGKNNLIRRNEGTASGTWSEPTTYPSISGNWQLCGFGNDTFMITSQDPVGLLTISRDAGKTWSTPIDFGIELAQPIYVDGDWYIGSQSGFTMISKNNGVTWEKIGSPGIKIDRFAYGNGMLVSAADNISYLIGLKKKKDDGSLITSDTITFSNPITIAYPIPILNTQLGYYTAGYYTTGAANTNDLTTSKSFCPIGPLLPGIYQASLSLVNRGSTNPIIVIECISRPTPFQNSVYITGSYSAQNNDGLYSSGTRSANGGESNLGNISINMAGFIKIPEGSLDRYACISLNSSAWLTINNMNLSVVRVG